MATKITTVSSINWKDSFLSYPFIVIHSLKPIQYRITIKEFTDDGVMTILPALSGTIDDVFEVLEGCLAEESNFSTVLKEYYGDSRKLKEIKFDFNEIEGYINQEMSAAEAKIMWLKNGIRAGYKGLVSRLTIRERRILNDDPEIKELIEKFSKQL